VVREGERVLLRDLGSRNGVHVNGVRLGTESVPLAATDDVTVGPASLRLVAR
jgi:pSer/pThr/pTyr-binding forkhead associated (FHA) protein